MDVALEDYPLTYEDYDMTSLVLERPTSYRYGQYANGGNGYHLVNGGVQDSYVEAGHWGYIATSEFGIPSEIIEAYINDEWQTVGTVSWSGSTASLDEGAAEGVSLNGYTLTLPEDTKQVRVSTESKAPGTVTYFSVRITVHSTEATRAIAQSHIDEDDNPAAALANHAHGDWYAGAGSERSESRLAWQDRYRTDTLEGAYQGARLDKALRYVNDTSNQQVRLTYAITLREQSNVTSRSAWDDAVANGYLTEETTGTFYDLLPEGVVLDPSTLSVTNGSVASYTLTYNYKDSGRTLLTVYANLTPSPTYITNGTTSKNIAGETVRNDVLGRSGMGDAHTLTFSAVYSWVSLVDYGQNIVNLAAFESGNTTIGSARGYAGEPDDPTGTTHYNNTTASATAGYAELLKDLDPSTDKQAFIYARSTVNLKVDTSATTGLTKAVAVNGLGSYGTGLGTKELNAYESGTYTYRLRMQSETGTTTSNIVIYDSLEQAEPTDADRGDATWQGSFAAIDVSQLAEKGCSPVVYYSTKENLNLIGDTNPNRNLSNRSIWSTTMPSDPSKVTAIAIDATQAEGGGDFELEEGESIVAFVRMTAPRASTVAATATQTGITADSVYDATLEDGQSEGGDNGWQGGAHAYNSSVAAYTQTSSAYSNGETVVKESNYTKVGLLPFQVQVKKEWNDASNQDGIRPDSVTVHLTANGAAATDDNGQELDAVTLSSSDDDPWTYTFDNVPAADANGYPIAYGVSEDTIEVTKDGVTGGYTAGVSQSYDEESGTLILTLTNTHKPTTISLSGTKAWDDGGYESKHPTSVRVNLLQDGKQYGTTTATASGGWAYSFTGLPRFHDGGEEYGYTVEEPNYVNGYVVSYGSDGSSITNTYSPYGNLTVGKKVEGVTALSANAEHVFSIELLMADGDPDPGEYDYVIYDTASGEPATDAEGNTLSGTFINGTKISLKGGQYVTIENIASEDTYTVTEAPAEGFTQTAVEGNAEGTIRAGQTSSVTFTNTYTASGYVTLSASKNLDGHGLSNYQFAFEVEAADGTILRTSSNDADGNVTFPRIRYSTSDLGESGTATYTYTIRERIPSGATSDNGYTLGGYTFDASEVTVTVALTDNGDGTISAVPTYTNAQGDTLDKATFTNSYHASGSTQIVAFKQLKGDTLEADQFTFKLVGSEDNPVRVLDDDGNVKTVGAEDGYAITATNDASGSVAFPRLQFDQSSVGKTYTYTVSEVVPNEATNSDGITYGEADDATRAAGGFTLNNVVYSTETYTYSVTVVDNDDGTLSFDVTSKDASGAVAEPTITNTMVPGNLEITKYVPQGDEGEDSDQTFTFKVKLTNEDGSALSSDGTSYTKTYEDVDAPPASSGAKPQTTVTTESEPDSTGGNLFIDFGKAILSLFTPTVAEAAEMHTYTVSLDPNGGEFSGESPYYWQGTYLYFISHTDNIDDNGDCISYFGGGIDKVDTMTPPDDMQGWALNVDVWYYTLDDRYAWLAIYPYNVTPSAENYNRATISNGKLGYDSKISRSCYTKDQAAHKYYGVYVSSCPIQFYFHSDSWIRYWNYGYYATAWGFYKAENRYRNTIPEEIYKGNSTFVGWYDAREGGNLVSNPYAHTETGDFTYYAHWVDHLFYTVTYKSTKGTFSDGSDTKVVRYRRTWNTKTNSFNSPTVLSGKYEVPTLEDAAMTGWYDSDGNRVTDPSVMDSSGSYTVYAQWADDILYDVTYKAIDGTYDDGDDTNVVKYRRSWNMSKDDWGTPTIESGVYKEPSADGEFFLGWYSDEEHTQSVTNPEVQTTDTTVYGYVHKYTHEGTCGGVSWGLQPDGVLVFWPTADPDGTKGITGVFGSPTNRNYSTSWWSTDYHYTFPWTAYASSIKSIESIGSIKGNADMRGMFYKCSNLTDISGLSTWDMSDVTNMYEAFRGCTKLADVSVLSSWNTSKVADMRAMFRDCNVLANISGLSSWDVSNATNMWCLFYNCYKLADISPIAGWNTSKVTDMDSTFFGLSSLTDASSLATWNTSQVTTMQNMFNGCSSLETLSMEYWNTSKVTNFYQIFRGCSNLKTVVLGTEVDFGNSRISNSSYKLNLPSPSGSLYTGKWVQVGGTEAYTSSELITNYDSTMAGTWVWQVANTAYTVRFDANGGSGSMAQVGASTSAAFTIPSNKFLRVGYTFDGWNTSADGGGTSYTDSQKLAANATIYNQDESRYAVAGDTVTLYAQWKVAPVTPVNGEFTVTLTANQKVTIEGLPAGTAYEVYEETPSGWTLVDYSDTSGTIPSNDTARTSFTNTKNVTPQTSVSISATKTIDGGASGAGGYGFTLYQVTKDALGNETRTQVGNSVTSTTGGAFTFAPIIYTETGDYTYVIKENVPQDGDANYNSNMVYDAHETTVLVHVAQGTGNALTATVTYTGGSTFNNTYQPGALTITKNVTGTTYDGTAFTFQVQLSNETNPRKITLDSSNNFTATIDNIPAGTTYTVREIDIPSGYALETMTNATGTIASNQVTQVTATNTYSASGTVTLNAYKSFPDGTLQSGDFSFQLFETRDDFVIPADAQPLQVATNDDDGNVQFLQIRYTAPGTYHYVIRELEGSDTSTIEYSQAALHVTVEVTDENHDGSLTTKATYVSTDTSDTTNQTFTNRLRPGSLAISKNVSGDGLTTAARAVLDGNYGRFSFVVTLANADGSPLSGTYTWTRGTETGSTTFEDGVGTVEVGSGEQLVLGGLPVGTSYTVTESADAMLPGFSFVSSEGENGTIISADETATTTFTNSYATSGSWEPLVTKKLDGSPLAEGEFTFQILDEQGNVVSTGTNAAASTPEEDGTYADEVNFGTVYYDASDDGKTYTYSIVEVDGRQDAITYQREPLEVTVKVEDLGNGQMKVTPTYGDGGEAAVFTNTWSVVLPQSGLPGIVPWAAGALALVGASAVAVVRRLRREEEGGEEPDS